ncbi:MAG: RNA-binding domain-containing protein [Candidatus Nezhaarchaeales archaeon]
MSLNAKLTSVEYTVFIHATEDYNKVIKAVENLLPPKIRSRMSIKVEETLGHYNNPIRIAKVSFRNPEQANQALSWIWNALSSEEKTYILTNLDLHIDEKMRLHVRLDKQGAFLGLVKLSFGDDVVKVVFSFKGPSQDAIRALLLSL